VASYLIGAFAPALRVLAPVLREVTQRLARHAQAGPIASRTLGAHGLDINAGRVDFMAS
jgi:hypothetical protein